MFLLTRRSMLAGCTGSTVSGQTGAPALQRLDGSRFSSEEADSKISSLVEKAKIAGLGVAVINEGKARYVRAFGMRDVERKLPLDPDTVMYGASFTKAAFAYMVMQLVDEGVIALDRPIGEYLPKPLPAFDKYKDLASDGRHKLITVRMLLSHTAGFPNFRFINPDGRLDFKFAPGTTYAYSGEGINLLQVVIEEKTGSSVGDMMKSRVFDRFAMRRTAMTWQPGWEANHAIGYDEHGKALGHNRRQSVRAAGSMDTTLADYTRFIEGVLRREGLTAKSWDAMFSPQIRIRSKRQFPSHLIEESKANDKIELSYGLGWGVFKTPFGRAYFKEGHDDGWENHSVCFDRGKTAVVLMSNSSNGDNIFGELLAFLIGDKYTPLEWEGYAQVV